MIRSYIRIRGHRLDPSLSGGALPSDSGLLGPLKVRAIVNALDIHPAKVLGQNFVHDARTVRRVVHTGGAQAGDEVVEVGPDLSSLTPVVLERGTRAHVVEIDPVLACALPETIHGHMPKAVERFHIVLDDATKVKDLDDFSVDQPTPMKLVASLPYNVAVPVLFIILESFLSLGDVLVIIQPEVASRLAASPGSCVYGVPPVKAVWYGTIECVGMIGCSIF